MTAQNDSSNCREIRSLLPAFLDDELAAPESHRVQEHLDGCAACAAFRRFEGAFDGAMSRTLGAGAAPASLVVRVHRALDGEEAGRAEPPRRALDRPWVRWALAASVLLIILGPGAIGMRTGMIRLPVSMAGVTQTAEGILVCAECSRMNKSVEYQKGCRAHGHHTALRTDSGELWEFVDSRETRPLLTDADRIGSRLRVEGLFLDELHYVRVDSYAYLPPSLGALQGL